MRDKDFYSYSILGYSVSSRKSYLTKEAAINALRSYFRPSKKRRFKYSNGRVTGVVYHYHHYSDDIPYACEVLVVYQEFFNVLS